MRYVSIADMGEPEFPREMAADVRLWLVSLLAAVLGVAAGFIDFAIVLVIRFATNLAFFQRWSFEQIAPWQNALGGWVIAVPVAGGLLVGLMARFGSPRVRGGGMAQTQEALILRGGRMQPRIAVLKPLAAAAAIGTGAPQGKEGPTIQASASLGSMISGWLRLNAAETRLVVSCSAAAGMGASYRTPISGALLAIEVMLFEVRSRTLVPLIVASTLAAGVSFHLAGTGMLVRVGPVHQYGVPGALPWYLLLGVLCGLFAVAMTHGLYLSKRLFQKVPSSTLWTPALGALAVGVIGYFVPRILGLGYDTDSAVFAGTLASGTLALVMVFKALALVFSWGSGNSGGLLSPMLMSGTALGALLARGVNRMLPGARLDPAAFALTAMGTVFGAASRAPFTFIVLPFEFARDNHALIPLLVVNVAATAVHRLFFRDTLQSRRLENR